MRIALIIPAYKPDEKLLGLLARFTGNADFAPVVVDDGSGAEFAPIFDALPEGVTQTTDGWYTMGGGTLPNSLIVPTQNYQMKDLAERVAQLNKEAKPSLALGFVFDPTEVTNQITACANVIAQYYVPLMYGEVDIDEFLPIFNDALHAAGIDDIIAAKQAQLDAWLAAKGE